MMVSELQSEIRENLRRYIDGASLNEFEDWFMPVLWDLSGGPDSEAKSLAGAISNLIAEYSCGHSNQATLRKELAAAIRPFEKERSGLIVVGGYSWKKHEDPGVKVIPLAGLLPELPEKIPPQRSPGNVNIFSPLWVYSSGKSSPCIPLVEAARV